MTQQVALPVGVHRSVELLIKRHLPSAYLSVHFRAGRILNRGTVDGGEGAAAENRFRRVPYHGRDLDAVLVYPLQCARELIARARSLMAEHGLRHVYLATDLVEGMMPELELTNPATTPPLMSAHHRRQLVETAEEAWSLLREHLNPVVYI